MEMHRRCSLPTNGIKKKIQNLQNVGVICSNPILGTQRVNTTYILTCMHVFLVVFTHAPISRAIISTNSSSRRCCTHTTWQPRMQASPLEVQVGKCPFKVFARLFVVFLSAHRFSTPQTQIHLFYIPLHVRLAHVIIIVRNIVFQQRHDTNRLTNRQAHLLHWLHSLELLGKINARPALAC